MKALRQANHHAAAFTLVELLVVIAIIAIMVGLFLPTLAGGGRANSVVCMSHLKQIALASTMWADDHDKKFPTETSITNQGTLEYVAKGKAYIHFRPLISYGISPELLVCPCDRNRQPITNRTAFFDNFNLSYFVTASFGTNPTAVMYSGDRNLTLAGAILKPGYIQFTNYTALGWTTNIHPRGANAAFLDGHVQWLVNHLPQTLSNSGIETYRLILP